MTLKSVAKGDFPSLVINLANLSLVFLLNSDRGEVTFYHDGVWMLIKYHGG